MLVDLTPIIQRGHIDNTQRDIIKLTLWFWQDDDPLQLFIKGNCLQDLAGGEFGFSICEHVYKPPMATVMPLYDVIAKLRAENPPILAGDITCSRRAPSVVQRGTEGNWLYVEFFVHPKIRFLIEKEEYNYKILLPKWTCTDAADAVQRMLNMCAMRDHVAANIKNYRGPGQALFFENMPPCRWDKILNHAEGCMSIMCSLHEKYKWEPCGLLSECFVMDRQDILDKLATAYENGDCNAFNTKSNWCIHDFVPKEDAPRLDNAMKHPLFEATSKLSEMVNCMIVSKFEPYRHSPVGEEMLPLLAGVISRVFATILLLQESEKNTSLVYARTSVLGSCLERLRGFARAMPPCVAEKYSDSLGALAQELQKFADSLRV